MKLYYNNELLKYSFIFNFYLNYGESNEKQINVIINYVLYIINYLNKIHNK